MGAVQQSPRVAIRDVAARAAVSPSSVSNYLNRRDRLSAPMQARIAAAIAELGFVPNDAARQLRVGESPLVGIVAFETANPFFVQFAEAVEREVEARGLFAFSALSNGDPRRERAYLDQLERQRVRGILIAPAGHVEERLLQLTGRGIPSVIFGRRSEAPEVSSVSSDDHAGGYAAVRHLAEQGRHRVAVVGAGFDVAQIGARLGGALRAGSEFDVAIEVIDAGTRTLEGGRTAGAVLAGNSGQRSFDGVFAMNDLLAIGVLEQLLSAGVAVPEQLALVGYDDIPFARSTAVPVTSVAHDHAELGRRAVRILLDGTGSPEQLVLQPGLRVRASSVGAA